MTSNGDMTDHDLILAYADGRNVESLGAFLGRYQDSVLRFVTRLLGDGDAAQDVVQETFLEIARRPRRLLKARSPHNWMLRVARNLGIDHLRRKARQRRHLPAAAASRVRGGEAANLAAEPVAALERKELCERVRAEIGRLSPRQRELLLLRIQEGKTYREIAEITGLSATNVGFILHQAMKSLSLKLRDTREV
ncbi:RNA polymerase sigma factor [Planctomycetota bacterium]